MLQYCTVNGSLNGRGGVLSVFSSFINVFWPTSFFLELLLEARVLTVYLYCSPVVVILVGIV